VNGANLPAKSPPAAAIYEPTDSDNGPFFWARFAEGFGRWNEAMDLYKKSYALAPSGSAARAVGDLYGSGLYGSDAGAHAPDHQRQREWYELAKKAGIKVPTPDEYAKEMREVDAERKKAIKAAAVRHRGKLPSRLSINPISDAAAQAYRITGDPVKFWVQEYNLGNIGAAHELAKIYGSGAAGGKPDYEKQEYWYTKARQMAGMDSRQGLRP
jgi:hypothetical protein